MLHYVTLWPAKVALNSVEIVVLRSPGDETRLVMETERETDKANTKWQRCINLFFLFLDEIDASNLQGVYVLQYVDTPVSASFLRSHIRCGGCGSSILNKFLLD